MLIDATHAEETRVVVVDGSRVEDFDFESQSRKQLRGNIYLAKVTRVEPSLQAAFIEYGGNRHGFLAFNEIHPDYYQIPLADREALLREEAEEADEHPARSRASGGDDEDSDVEDDDDDVMGEEVARRTRRLMRRYKIQEVIRRRQIMLVQVVKEERGNKGAALTTYLSLAGRYGVLMPNTPRGGGISRKITTATDRKRLKTIVQGLEVPQGMGLIVRTAGAKRTKAELKRDYEYLMRLWEDIREKTLHSIAPALIYEEEDLVKRAIRDMYDKELDGIWVEGEAGFREARDFMRMLMPSQAKKVIHYRDPTPLFMAAKVEDHLAQIYTPVVPLKSGGYLVINQTEALVAIDVNSGRSTRERNIEATALKTNMEAAAEAARQLRLRDLAGLIVIDFIDMDEGKNNRAVEKVLKDALKDDRARVQMGKISGFGLMEISRQRRRTGVLEGTTHVCEHCQGIGRVRSVESSALAALRAIEMEAVRDGAGAVTLRLPRAIALYILNEKRVHLALVQQRHGLFVTVVIDDALAYADHQIERTESLGHEAAQAAAALTSPLALAPEPVEDDLYEDIEDEAEDEEEVEDEDGDEAEAEAAPRAARESAPRDAAAGEDDGAARNRRRRRRRGRRGDEPADRPARAAEPAEAAGEAVAGEDEDDGGEGLDAQGRRRRRRGRRGGRRMREDTRRDDVYAWSRPRVPEGDPYIWMDAAQIAGGGVRPAGEAPVAPALAPAEPDLVAEVAAEAEDANVIPFPAPGAPEAEAAPAASGEPAEEVWVELPPAPEPAAKPARARRSRAKAKPAAETVAEPAAETVADAAPVPEPVAPPEPVAAEAEPAPAPESVVEAEPVAEAAPAPEPEPVAIAGVISSPPEKPKRGWWRRNG
jgi:ribonuclease E